MPGVRANVFREVEKLLKYRWGDKERERSNRAAGLNDRAQGTARRCPSVPPHDRIAWSGPPHDSVRAYICLECHAMASEPEIKDRNWDFDQVPDWIIHEIFDLDLQRQAEGNPVSFHIGNVG